MRSIKGGFYIVGYVQLYFEIIGENNTYYATVNMDFGKALNYFRLFKIKNSIKKIHEEFYHEKIIRVNYITKEKYEENSSECKDTLKHTWKKDTGKLNE